MDHKGPRKLSDTLSSCLKKNESYIDRKQDDKSYNITNSFTVDAEISGKGKIISIVTSNINLLYLFYSLMPPYSSTNIMVYNYNYNVSFVKSMCFNIFLFIAKMMDIEDSGSAHSEIIDIRIDNATLSSHHQILDRKRKITNIPPHVDAILLSNVDDRTEGKGQIGEKNIDTSSSCESVRKTSDVSNSSKLSCGMVILFFFT